MLNGFFYGEFIQTKSTTAKEREQLEKLRYEQKSKHERQGNTSRNTFRESGRL